MTSSAGGSSHLFDVVSELSKSVRADNDGLRRGKFSSDLLTDLSNLVGWNSDSFSSSSNVSACADVQEIIYRLYQLPTIENEEQGRVVGLPPPTTNLPKSKTVIPKADRPLSRWEEFAKSKNIHKTGVSGKSGGGGSVSNKVWDDTKQEWGSSFGKNRANSIHDEWLVVDNTPGFVPTNGEDPFLEAKLAKKGNMIKNEEHRERNAKRGRRDITPDNAEKIDYSKFKKGGKDKNRLTMKKDGEYVQKEESKDQQSQARKLLDVASVSTASLGRFDKYSKEKDSDKTREKKRQKVAVHQKSGIDAEGVDEKTRNTNILKRLFASSGATKGKKAALNLKKGEKVIRSGEESEQAASNRKKWVDVKSKKHTRPNSSGKHRGNPQAGGKGRK